MMLRYLDLQSIPIINILQDFLTGKQGLNVIKYGQSKKLATVLGRGILKFSYGDRVRITVTLYDPMVPFLAGITAGSTGRVVSFEEYCLYRHWDIGGSGFPERVKAQIQNGSLYPVRIVSVTPLESSEVSLSCEPYQLIGSNHLLLMGKDEPETFTK